MQVWITKYALSQGIFKSDVEDEGKGTVKEVACPFSLYYHGEGKEWHRTKESAIAKAEEMRREKIADLKKQIEKLEGMEFDDEKPNPSKKEKAHKKIYYEDFAGGRYI